MTEVNTNPPTVDPAWDAYLRNDLPGSAKAAAALVDPIGYEEDAEYARRLQLGLRPIHYRAQGPHPDQRGCPAWCWINEFDGADHEMDAAQPMVALHTTIPIAIVAAAYRGEAHGDPCVVSTATWEAHLHQVGARTPQIRVDLRAMVGDQDKLTERMRLGLTDAHELVTVLTHLIAQAEAAAMLPG